MNLAHCYEAKGFAKRFEHLLALMSDPKFLAMESVGNEIPFYICPYLIAQNEQMKKDIDNLKIQLMQKNIEVLEIDLYLLSLDLLKSEDILDELLTILSNNNNNNQSGAGDISAPTKKRGK